MCGGGGWRGEAITDDTTIAARVVRVCGCGCPTRCVYRTLALLLYFLSFVTLFVVVNVRGKRTARKKHAVEAKATTGVREQRETRK